MLTWLKWKLRAMAVAINTPAMGQESGPESQVLFANVHVFYGVNEARIGNASFLVEGNLVKWLSADPIVASGAIVTEGGGRTRIPGMIDNHWHTSCAYVSPNVLFAGEMSEPS